MKDYQPIKQRYQQRNPAMLSIMSKMKSILDRLRGAKFISTIDLKNGYWQIPMEESSKQYTAFTVPGKGLFQFKVMPFGLHSAPATFQRTLDSVIGPELEPHAFAYLDDIVVIGRTLEEHKINLRRVFHRLREANLRVNLDKCEFFKTGLRYLGHWVSDEGIHIDPQKIAAIGILQPPTNIKQLRSCLGLASYCRRFVPKFADLVNPLNELLRKGKHWYWGERQQQAFDQLKKLLTEAPVLACPDFEQTFTLQTDASNYGLGAVLTQELDGAERVISYASRQLNKAEMNYSTTEKECLAIVWGIRMMRPYIEGYHFKVVTDHLSLKWLNSIDNPTGRIARWALELQQYSFDIIYRKGKLNVVADMLSRQPLENHQQAQITEPEYASCRWIQKRLRELKTEPDKNTDYSIVEGRLYRHIPSQTPGEDNTQWKLCVPSHLRHKIMEENHAATTAGHLGIRKTINRVANCYYWPGMMRDIAKYVKTCDLCQRYKTSQQQPAGEMLTRIAQAPWETVCADFVGPLPRSKHGNTVLLVFVDKFTKWVELVPLRRATGETLQKAVRTSIISRFGTPKVLICDNGTQFTCHKFQKYLEEMGIHQQLTAPYTPQENPTERSNRTIKTMIAQSTGNNHKLWDEYLPEISLAINSCISETTGFSPAYLMQGRELRLPKLMYDKDILGNGKSTEDPQAKATRLQEIYTIVKRNLGKAANDQARHYNLRRRKWKPEIGELVLLKQHPLSKAIDSFAAKLAPRYDGPYQIWRYKSPVIVELKDGQDGKIRTAHVSDIKNYHQGPEEADTQPKQ